METTRVSKRQWVGEGGFNTFNTLLLLIEKECIPRCIPLPFPFYLFTQRQIQCSPSNRAKGMRNLAFLKGWPLMRGTLDLVYTFCLYEEWSLARVTTQRRTTVPYWSRLHRRVNDPDPSLCEQKSAWKW